MSPSTSGRTSRATGSGVYGADGYVIGGWNGGDQRPRRPAGRGDATRSSRARATTGRSSPATSAPSRVPTRASAGRRAGTTRPRPGSGSTSPAPYSGTLHLYAVDYWLTPRPPRERDRRRRQRRADRRPLDRLHQRRLDALPDQRRGRRLGDHQGRQGRRRQRRPVRVSSWAARGRRRPPPPPSRHDRPTQASRATGSGVYGADGYVIGGWNGGDQRPRRPAGRGDATRSSRARATRGRSSPATSAPSRVPTRASAGRRAGTTRPRPGSGSTSPAPYSGTLHLYAVDDWLTPTRRENVTVDDGSGARTAIALDRLHQRRLDALPDQRRGRRLGDHQGRPGRRRQRRLLKVSSWAAQGRRRTHATAQPTRSTNRRQGRLGRGVRRRRLRHRRLERRDHRPRRPAGRGDATRSSRARATLVAARRRRPRPRESQPERAPGVGLVPTRPRPGSGSTSAAPYSGTLHLYAVDRLADARAAART